jgi:hypothetical protein
MREHELNGDSERESLIQCISFERDLCAEFNDFPYAQRSHHHKCSAACESE